MSGKRSRRSRGKGLIFGTFGDYEYSARSLTLLNARLEFVNAISRCCPNVFEALHTEPLAKYKESGFLSINAVMRHMFWEEIIAGRDRSYYFNASPRVIERLPLLGGPQNLECNLTLVGLFHMERAYDAQLFKRFCKAEFPKIQTFMDSLCSWASAHYLDFGWMLHWAFLKLDSYADESPGGDRISPKLFRLFSLGDIFGKDTQPQLVEPGGLYDHRVGMELDPLTFAVRGWRPSLQTAARYEDSARWLFEQSLEQYLEAAQSKLAADHAVSRIQVKLERAHFDWLVCRQVQGMTADAILGVWSQRTADEAKQHSRQNMSAQGVNKAITEAATLVGFMPRRVGRGPAAHQ